MIYLESSIVIDLIGVSGTRGESTRARIAADDFDSQLVTSPLVDLECMVRPLRARNYAGASATRDLLRRFRQIEISKRCYELATHIRADYGLGVPDALHIATASLGGCDELWSFDDGLLRAAPGFVVNPLISS